MTEMVVAVAVALLGFGAVSRLAERSPITPPMFFVGFGFLAGGSMFAVVEPDLDGAAIHFLAEIALVLVLFTDASRIHLDALRQEESLPARLLGLGLPLCVLLGTGVALWVLPGFTPAEALLLAAILAPTDAALGQAVVSNPRVPLRIRQSLNVESGLNDGLALPLVLFAASLAASGASGAPSSSAGDWARFAATALVLGPVVGVAVGGLGGPLLERAIRAGWINGAFQKLSSLGLAFLAFGGAELIGGNGFIAAFVAGLALGNTAPGICPRLHEFAEAEGQLLTLLVFMAFGAVAIPEALPHMHGAVWLYAVLSLTVVRMLPVGLALLGGGLRRESVAFLGWFGPRGLASILFVLLVVERGGLRVEAELEAVVFATVLLSTVLHGLSAFPLAQRYADRVQSGAAAEHRDAPALPVRLRH